MGASESLRTALDAVGLVTGLSWLDEQCAALAGEASDASARRRLGMAIAQAARRLGREAVPALPDWSADQVARVLLILALPDHGPEALVDALDHCFRTADVAEAVALYQGLAYYPHPEAHRPRCAEGIRSNQTSSFLAVAHGNPYPAHWLDEDAWNQMVLKCLFVNASLAPVLGLDERANPRLSRMLADFARERRAAGRPINAELWRCVSASDRADAGYDED